VLLEPNEVEDKMLVMVDGQLPAAEAKSRTKMPDMILTHGRVQALAVQLMVLTPVLAFMHASQTKPTQMQSADTLHNGSGQPPH
jgi:hypothetical protein